MSLESILRRIREAFDQLNRGELPPKAATATVAPRPRASEHGQTADGAPALSKEGFAEEALPWMEAVHRFALRLTRGDPDRAADLVQETFLKAYRSWDSFRRGTNCRAWLFTICKNTHMHARDLASTRREIPEAHLDVDLEAAAVHEVHAYALGRGANVSVFDGTLDERVVAAIDALPDDFRDVLVLSDLADLRYAEISAVLELPVGTVKSRLFRARRLLQKSLIDYAVETGFMRGASA